MTQLAPVQEGKPLQLEFTGSGGEYFKIWIVNILLSIVTLGIYSAWAKVRNKRYFYGNTRLDGSPFEYLATPGMILKGRIIAVGLFVIYSILGELNPIVGLVLPLVVLFLAPLIIRNSICFSARMTAYRNVNFDFKGGIGEAYILFLVFPLLPLLAASAFTYLIWQGWLAPSLMMMPFGPFYLIGVGVGLALLFAWLLTPMLQFKTASYFVNNSYYGQGRFRAELNRKTFYRIHLMLSTVVIGFVGINLVLAALFMMKGLELEATSGFIGLLIYAQMLLLSVFIRAFLRAEISNYVASRTELENTVRFKAQFSSGKLFIVYLVNILLLIVTLGLARPWTLVRVQNYLTENLHAFESGNLAVFVAQQEQAKSSLGEEVGEAFDLDTILSI